MCVTATLCMLERFPQPTLRTLERFPQPTLRTHVCDRHTVHAGTLPSAHTAHTCDMCVTATLCTLKRFPQPTVLRIAADGCWHTLSSQTCP